MRPLDRRQGVCAQENDVEIVTAAGGVLRIRVRLDGLLVVRPEGANGNPPRWDVVYHEKMLDVALGHGLSFRRFS